MSHSWDWRALCDGWGTSIINPSLFHINLLTSWNYQQLFLVPLIIPCLTLLNLHWQPLGSLYRPLIFHMLPALLYHMFVNAFMGTLYLKTCVLCRSWYLNLSIIKGLSFEGDFSFYYINIDHPPLSVAKVTETVDLNLRSPSGPSRPVMLRPHRALRYVRYVCFVRYVRYTKWPHWLRFVRDMQHSTTLYCWLHVTAWHYCACLSSATATAHARPQLRFKI